MCVQDFCLHKLGSLESRVRLYRFEEVRAKNAEGECWLILDGALIRACGIIACPEPEEAKGQLCVIV